MTIESEFHFKENVDMNALAKQIGQSLAGTIGIDPVIDNLEIQDHAEYLGAVVVG